MPATVTRLSMGWVSVTTEDRYGNTDTYEFKPADSAPYLEPTGDGRDYTPVVLKALWREGIVVDWDADDLSASERAQIDGFCDDCGAKIQTQKVGRDEWAEWCPECDGRETVEVGA